MNAFTLRTRWIAVTAAAATVAGVFSGCGNPYGYARSYIYLDDERPYTRRSDVNLEAVYDEVRRLPQRYDGQVISWFGRVTAVEPQPDGTARVAMQVRTHQERHLCEAEPESSCRVTVSENDGGPFTAMMRLRAEDQTGANRVQVNSLVRVYGTVVQGEYDAEGGPILRGQYYRHWPRGQYVTTAARGTMRY